MGALWYPVGFTAGYLLHAARSSPPRCGGTGALTVPDFAEARLGSPLLRRAVPRSSCCVIGCLYLVPQFTAARAGADARSSRARRTGSAWSSAAPWSASTLALGGMRAATYVQAFQFLLKLLLFVVPAMLAAGQRSGPQVRDQALHPVEFTRFAPAHPRRLHPRHPPARSPRRSR